MQERSLSGSATRTCIYELALAMYMYKVFRLRLMRPVHAVVWSDKPNLIEATCGGTGPQRRQNTQHRPEHRVR